MKNEGATQTEISSDQGALVHIQDDGSERIIADSVEMKDTFLSRARGLMFRKSPPEACYFDFRSTDRRTVHMLFVNFPLKVCWLIDDKVVRVESLEPWTGIANERANAIVELPGTSEQKISSGDQIKLLSD
ncbi:MAG: DUF192 domain-containing protein [Halobacteriaceae archaeon]